MAELLVAIASLRVGENEVRGGVVVFWDVSDAFCHAKV